MESTTIDSYAELLLRIEYLKAEKVKQEEDLKKVFSEFVDTLNPLLMVKQTIHKLAADGQVKRDLTTAALNVGVTFLVGRMLGRNRIENFIGSKLANGISRLFNKTKSSTTVSDNENFLPQEVGIELPEQNLRR
jgi:hypothetical protein